MTIIDLIAVVLVCLTALGIFVAHRYFYQRDRTREREDHECDKRELRELWNKAQECRDAAEKALSMAGFLQRDAATIAESAAKSKTDVTALVEGINANFDKVREEIGVIKAALGYGKRGGGG